MKVFIGLTDIASQISQYKAGFNNNKVETITVVRDIGTKRNSKELYDFNLSEGKKIVGNVILVKWINKYLKYKYKRKIWHKAIKECDIFIFIWSTFKSNYSDIEKLKKLNKKVIVIFVGSDIRWKRAMEQEFIHSGLDPIEYANYIESIEYLEQKLKYLRIAEKYADVIYSIPNQSQLSLRPYFLFKYPLNLCDYVENIKTSIDEIVVIHAPTYPEVKGTKYVVKAFEKLKSEGINFKIKMIKDLPFRDIVNEYSNADILVGQLLAPGGGKQEREALASGTVVLSNMSYDKYEQKIPLGCPIIDVNKDNLYHELKEIIINHEKRESIAKQGRKWVEDNYNVNNLVMEILDNLENPRTTYDFIPTFFREKYIPEYYEIGTLNHFNHIVKDTIWYKQYVQSGEREGLLF